MIDNLKKDSVFGEPFLLSEESQHYYVCAKSETRVLFIAYEHVIKRCENACKFHSQLVSNLLQMIGQPDLCAVKKQHSKEDHGLFKFHRRRKTDENCYFAYVLHHPCRIPRCRPQCHDAGAEEPGR